MFALCNREAIAGIEHHHAFRAKSVVKLVHGPKTGRVQRGNIARLKIF